MATPKTPQDHKPKAADVTAEAVARFEDIDGSHLLVPFTKVKGSDQLRLMGKLKALGVTDSESNVLDLDLDELADFIDWVAGKFAVDTAAFEEFTSGAGGFERALNLAIAYSGALGESDSSES